MDRIRWYRASKIIRGFRRFILDCKKYNLSTYAAGSAFFTFLSFIPLLILLCSILPYTGITREDLLSYIDSVITESLSPLALQILYEIYEKSGAILSVSAVIALWSAGKGIFSLMQGLNTVNDAKEERGFLILRLKASLDTLAFILALAVVLGLAVYGRKTFGNQGFLFGWLLLILVFSTLYKVMPSKEMLWKWQIPGAVLASSLWILFSFGFSVYVEWFHGFSMYGSLATIMIALFWLYFSMYIILSGALVNRYFEDYYKNKN